MGWVSAAVGIGTALVGGYVATKGADQAADAQTGAAQTAAQASQYATDQNIAFQKEMFEQGREDSAPWLAAGKDALDRLTKAVNEGPGDFEAFDYENSPGYQFRLEEGQKALDRANSARGNFLGGGAIKEAMRYGQNFATSDYNNQKSIYDSDRSNFFKEYYDSLRPDQSLAGIGQTTAQQGSVAGQNLASNTGNALMSNAANQGNAAMASGNAIASGAINNANAITGNLNAGINNYLMWKNKPADITG